MKLSDFIQVRQTILLNEMILPKNRVGISPSVAETFGNTGCASLFAFAVFLLSYGIIKGNLIICGSAGLLLFATLLLYFLIKYQKKMSIKDLARDIDKFVEKAGGIDNVTSDDLFVKFGF